MNNITRKIIFGIVLAIIIYTILIFYGDINKMAKAFSRFKWIYFAVCLLLAFFNYLIRFVKWEFYLKRLSIKIPYRDSFLIFISGFMLSLTPGKVGEVMRSFLLKEKYNIPVSTSAPIVVADRLSDMIALLILAALGLSFFHGWIILTITFILILIVILIIEFEKIGYGFIWIVEKVPFVGVKLKNPFLNSYQSLRKIGNARVLLLPLILSVIAWGCEGIGLYIVVNLGFGDNFISATESMFIYSFSTIAGAVAFLPAGLGVTEGSLTALIIKFSHVEITRTIASMSTIVFRFATLWFSVILSFIAYFIYKKNKV